MRIAVLGANGRLANSVAKAFLDHGHSVIAVTRSGKVTGLQGAVEMRAADAMKEADIVAATRGADIIFNGLNPLYHQWEALAMPMAINVMAAARTHHIPHLFIGNVYNYGTAIPLGATESTPHSNDTDKARIRNEMEALFEREALENGVKTVILRAGDFYGTSAKGSWFDQAIAAKVEKGIFTWPGPLDRTHAFAYLPDLADAFVRIAENLDKTGPFETFNFEGHTLNGAQFKALTEKALGRSLKVASLPWWLLRLAGPFNPVMRELVKMSYLWQVPHSLDGSKFAQRFGAPTQTSAELAIRQALVDHGKLAAPLRNAA